MDAPMYEDMQAWEKDAYLGGVNAAYLEQAYELYLTDPSQVSDELCQFFTQLKPNTTFQDISHAQLREQFRVAAHTKAPIASTGDAGVARTTHSPSAGEVSLQLQVQALITAYRQWGHLAAQLDPLGSEPQGHAALDPSFHGIGSEQLTQQVPTQGILAEPYASVEQIIQALRAIYCGHFSAEFTYISDIDEQRWLQQQIETRFCKPQLSQARQRWLAQQLIAAEGMEKYLSIKYAGQKRFSIEGLESLIPHLNMMIEAASGAGVEQVVLGMAHRGRLNVMLNVAGMSAKELCAEFEGKEDYGDTSGDVRYHLGCSSDIKTLQGQVHVTLEFNPSHLEFINPVLIGSVKARQINCAQGDPNFCLGILMHGDAAIAGEGVVYETFNMANLRGYTVGGSLHVVTNNQIGFTTSDARDTRSARHCTDIAKLIEAPVLHINADHPELVVLAAELAVAYRMRFHKDMVINLVGYRRHGHQEVDEPTSSAPLRYQQLKSHPTVCQKYCAVLCEQGVLTAEEQQKMAETYEATLDTGAPTLSLVEPGKDATYHNRWQAFMHASWDEQVNTSITPDQTASLAQKISAIPEGMQLVKPVAQIIQMRAEMAAGEKAMDWGFAENMAYASLLSEGISVRFSGQDVRRGTFYHRHAFWFDAQTNAAYSPLMHLAKDQARLQLYDSILNETAVLGFEYGYACTDPYSLVIWEAQFGDFANTAQVIIDQFISSAWQKWKRLSGLVMLLPHGYDGAGPEHSSARLERYLQLAAQKNMQIIVPTTPAQIFHVLRRQVLRKFRHPLIVMSPKNLLRHKLATSNLDELTTGSYQEIIPEIDALDAKKIERVILCAGKIYYELLQARREHKLEHIAIIRIEQLYPFPYDALIALLATYTHSQQVIWCQEEPKNQGAWYVTRDRIQHCLHDAQQLSLISRPASAAPSAGYHALHAKQQKMLIEQALNIEKDSAAS